jgi:hypothetical protein
MNYLDFIAIMRSWYPQITIKMDQNNNNNDNRRPITLSVPGNPSLPIEATNDILTSDDVRNVQKWLMNYSRKIDKDLKLGGVLKLGQASIVWDYTNTGLLPDGYQVITEESGARTIFDADGQNIGSLRANASLIDKSTLVMTAQAEDISEEWVSDPPDNPDDIVLSDSVMETTTRLSESDIAAVTADLNAQPDIGPLADDSMDDLNEDSLRVLSSDVGMALVRKGAISLGMFGIRAPVIDQICKDNGFTFEYIGTDDTSSKGTYLIHDGKGNFFAKGQLQKFATTYYVTNPTSLKDQIKDAKFVAGVDVATPPEQSARTNRQEARFKDYLAERKKGPGKPGKGPDPDKKDPNGNGQDEQGN